MKEAMFWKKEEDKIRCRLCSHNCIIPQGKRGICGVRENRNGKLQSLIYGLASSVIPDPIEKKPLYHFQPGTNALSFGTIGCNFRCPHCQNYTISQASIEDAHLQHVKLEDIANLAKKYRCKGVAWTYNEPTIWYEFTLDGSKIAKRNGLYSVYVTNGFISEEPLKEISPYLDAMNIDVKAFNENFYKKIVKARLRPVLDTCILAKELGIHIELTYLIIPSYNDDKEEIKKYCQWIVNELGDETPCHFSRFHPHYKMIDVPSTPLSTLEKAYQTAIDEGLKYVYLGNVPNTNKENTYCPECGKLLIERNGFSTSSLRIKDGKCLHCGEEINIVQ
jgi:pyruvate formate lyase activating enzyme